MTQKRGACAPPIYRRIKRARRLPCLPAHRRETHDSQERGKHAYRPLGERGDGCTTAHERGATGGSNCSCSCRDCSAKCQGSSCQACIESDRDTSSIKDISHERTGCSKCRGADGSPIYIRLAGAAFQDKAGICPCSNCPTC